MIPKGIDGFKELACIHGCFLCNLFKYLNFCYMKLKNNINYKLDITITNQKAGSIMNIKKPTQQSAKVSPALLKGL